MLHVERPSISALDTFRACYLHIGDADLATRLMAQESHIQERSEIFEAAAIAGGLFSLAAADFLVPTIAKGEAEWLYNERLVNSSAGRKIYLRIRGSARDGLCSLCGIRPAATLDHHLAKASFHALTVNPLNLVPACFECNHGKGAVAVDTPHPYFDDLSGHIWLTATVMEVSPCVVQFSVSVPPQWSADLASKVKSHFEQYKLNALYGAQAGRQLAGIRRLLADIARTSNATGVRTSLEAMRDSWEMCDLNCWEAALYRSLASSDWYCERGFDS